MNMNMSNVTSLSTCGMGDNKTMQFPLSQRRKRRVLFTQAQVNTNFELYFLFLLIKPKFQKFVFVIGKNCK